MRIIYFVLFFMTVFIQGQEYTIYYQGYLPKIISNSMVVITEENTPYGSELFPEIDQKQHTLYQLSIKNDKSVFMVQKGVYNDTLVQIHTNATGGTDTLQRVITREDKIVYKDRNKENKYTYIKHPTGLRGRIDEFLFDEPLKDFNWKVTTKTKKILGHLCKMAVSGEGEEMVIAWYTEEIPLSEGPSGYWGLPGLILEINKHDNPFQAMHITKSILVNNVTPPDHLQKTERGASLHDKSLLYEN